MSASSSWTWSTWLRKIPLVLNTLRGLCRVAMACAKQHLLLAWKRRRTTAGGVEFVRSLAAELAKENVLFVKIFQYLSSFKQDFSQEVLEVLRSYTNHSSFSEHELNPERLAYVAAKYGVISWANDGRPVNSASVALVYRANTVQYGRVAVKMKKRNVEPFIRTSCAQIELVFQCLKALYALPSPPTTSTLLRTANGRSVLDLMQPFVDNLDNLVRQCDFGTEIRNLRRAHADSATLRSLVHIPECFNAHDDEGADTEFIVMEFVDGLTHVEMETLLSTPGDAWHSHRFFVHLPPQTTAFQVKYAYARSILIYCFYSAMFSSNVHVDMHPGNLLFTDRLCILDFGMCEWLDDERRRPIVDIFGVAQKAYRRKSEIAATTATTATTATATTATATASSSSNNESHSILDMLLPAIEDTDGSLGKALDAGTGLLRSQVNQFLYELIVETIIIKGDIDEYKFYEAIVYLRRMLKMDTLRLKKYMYNFLLGIAMVNKNIHGLLEFRKEFYDVITEDSVNYLFMDDDDDEGDE